MRQFIRRVGCVVLALSFVVSMCGLFSSCQEETTDERVEAILEGMTLKEKIAQKIIVDLRKYAEEGEEYVGTLSLNDEMRSFLNKYAFGGVILFAENYSTIEQTIRLVDDMQTSSKYPLLIATDQEGGRVTRLSFGTTFGGNASLAATGDTEFAKKVAQAIGEELSSLGINTNFAPVLDVNTNPANPVINVRSFSSDAQVASEMGVAYLEGLHSAGVISSLKHFPGHGDTATDSHTGLPLVNKTKEEIMDVELAPFKAAIEQGADIVMTAHIQYPQIETETYQSILDGETVYLPATLSKTMITDILRGDLHFEGVVCTDSLVMDAIRIHFDPMDVARLSINAGVDILLMPLDTHSKEELDQMEGYIDGIAAMVENGDISIDTIDTSVRRILKLKIEKGIWDKVEQDVNTQIQRAEKVIRSAEHVALEWEAALQAVTEIKNNDVFPITDSKVAVFFPYEGEQVMGEKAFSRIRDEKLANVEETFVVYGNNEASAFTSIIEENDVFIVLSEMSNAFYFDPEHSKGWQSRFIDSLITLAHEKGKKVVLLSASTPYDIVRYPDVDAIVCTYNASNASSSVAAGIYAMFSHKEMTGSMPFDIYGIDTSYQYTDTIVFPSGYGK